MKRGSFLRTTVATGLMVAGLMTVGRAGLKSQGFLFLAGQLKIAAGDTDSGMKLLARAASGPEFNSNSMLASEKESGITEKPCAKSNPAPLIRKLKTAQVPVRVKYAPEPTMASIAQVEIPMASFVQPGFHVQADPATLLSHQQLASVRAQRIEMNRARRVREINTSKLLREVAVKYGPNAVPDGEQIRMQVQKELGTWAQ